MRNLIPVVLLALSACTVSVTKEEIAAAHFGAAPTNYERSIRAIMASRIDAGSAKFRFIKPAKGFGMINGKRFGWIVKAYINAKNNKGEYVGELTYYFLFADGKSWDVTDGFNLGRARFIEPPKE